MVCRLERAFLGAALALVLGFPAGVAAAETPDGGGSQVPSAVASDVAAHGPSLSGESSADPAARPTAGPSAGPADESGLRRPDATKASASRVKGPRGSGTVILAFQLTNQAVASTASISSGAILTVSGTRGGRPATDVVPSRTTTHVDFAPVAFDAGSTVNYVVNYRFAAVSDNGSGFGKVTGSYVVGTDTSTARLLSGTATDVAVTVGTDSTKLLVTNPVNISRTSPDFEYALNAYRFMAVPKDAVVVIRDARDGTAIPEYSRWMQSGTPRLSFSFPQPQSVGALNTFTYEVSREGYAAATGTITAKRTDGAGTSKPELAFSPNGDEKSFVARPAERPPILDVELKAAPRQSIGVAFVVSVPDGTVPDVTLRAPGGALTKDPSSTRTHWNFVVPREHFDQVLTWTIEAPGFRTLTGGYRLSDNGDITDETPPAVKALAISYAFDPAAMKLAVRLRPSPSVSADDRTGGHIDLDRQINHLFVDSLPLYGGSVDKGTLEITNTLPYRAKVVGVTVDRPASLEYPVMRTMSAPAAHVFGKANTTMSAFLDLLDAARAKYPGKSVKAPGQDFRDYSDYLLYYFRNDLAGQNSRQYPGLTDLKDLDPTDMGEIFGGNFSFRKNSPLDLDFDLPSESAIPVPYRLVVDGGIALLETDPVVDELANYLLFTHGLYFTLDSTLAPNGELPTARSDLAARDYSGLAFDAYVNSTAANKAEVAAMIDGIVLDPGQSHLFRDASLSTIGSYLHNGFLNNQIDFDVSFELLLAPVGIDGFVFHDANKNGSFDPGEAVEAGVEVALTEEDGRGEVASVTTNSAGYYAFAQGSASGSDRGDVPGGYAIVAFDQAKKYHAEFAVPAGKAITTGRGIGDPRLDNRFGARASRAVSDTVAFDADDSFRLNAGLVAADAPEPPPGPPGPVTPTPPPVDPTVPPEAREPGGTLPRTGTDPWAGALFGLLFVGVGAVLVTAARRRRRTGG